MRNFVNGTLVCVLGLGFVTVGTADVANVQIQRLMQEKQEKMERLEKCSKKVSGFKIAGISTLGLTAVGIGGNVALASKNKGMQSQIDNVKKTLTSENKKLSDLETDVKKAQELAASSQRDDTVTAVNNVEQSVNVVNVANAGTETTAENSQQEVPSTEPEKTEQGAQSAEVVGVIGADCTSFSTANVKEARWELLSRQFKWSKKCTNASSNVVDCYCNIKSCISDEYEIKDARCVKIDREAKAYACIKDIQSKLEIKDSKPTLKVADHHTISDAEMKEIGVSNMALYVQFNMAGELFNDVANACDVLGKLNKYITMREGFMKKPQFTCCTAGEWTQKYAGKQCSCKKDIGAHTFSDLKTYGKNLGYVCAASEIPNYANANIIAATCYHPKSYSYIEMRSKYPRESK